MSGLKGGNDRLSHKEEKTRGSRLSDHRSLGLAQGLKKASATERPKVRGENRWPQRVTCRRIKKRSCTI